MSKDPGRTRPGPPAAPPERTVRAALAYAARGWPVFPCQPGGKKPATRHGFRDATTDPDRIRAWWQASPAANLAVATGAPGPDVLDVDQRGTAGSGYPACQRLAGAGLLGGAFAVIATPGGGLHAYFPGSAQPSGRLARCHLDFKAQGGYVLAPPSAVGGRAYRLLACRDPAPAGLDWAKAVSLLEPGSRAPARPRHAGPGGPGRGDAGRLAAWVAALPEGNRNSGLFWAACRAATAGQPGLLDQLAAAAATAGLGQREITATIASASRAAQRGRQLQAGREITR